MAPNHPAKYSKQILPILKGCLHEITGPVLDCMAGIGGIHKLANDRIKTVGIELEHEWAAQHPSNINGDALLLPFRDSTFAAICVSPVYGNRMSDHHNAKDGSKRNTYTHQLGRQLNDSNAGKLQWGEKYREFHVAAWKEAIRVAQKTSRFRFIINVSNHIRKGEEIDVTGWHVETLQQLGLSVKEHYMVKTPRNRQGQNGHLRVDHEHVYSFRFQQHLTIW